MITYVWLCAVIGHAYGVCGLSKSIVFAVQPLGSGVDAPLGNTRSPVESVLCGCPRPRNPLDWTSGCVLLWWMCATLHARLVRLPSWHFACWKGGTHYSQTRTHAEQSPTSLHPHKARRRAHSRPLVPACLSIAIIAGQVTFSAHSRAFFSVLDKDTCRKYNARFPLSHYDMLYMTYIVWLSETCASFVSAGVLLCIEHPAAAQSHIPHLPACSQPDFRDEPSHSRHLNLIACFKFSPDPTWKELLRTKMIHQKGN